VNKVKNVTKNLTWNKGIKISWKRKACVGQQPSWWSPWQTQDNLLQKLVAKIMMMQFEDWWKTREKGDKRKHKTLPNHNDHHDDHHNDVNIL
jgi:hypothetical protein